MILVIEGKKFRVDVLSRCELNDSLIQQWSELEQRSVEGNAYLSPHFILPSIKHLTPSMEVVIVFVTCVTGNTSRLAGVGVFEYCRWTKRLPLPHFKAYRSPHSYLSGLLVDEELMDSTVSAFFAFFRTSEKYSCGVEFINQTANARLGDQMQLAASRCHVRFRKYGRKQRAILIPGILNDNYLQESLSQKLKKSLRYNQNVLAKSGMISWNVVEGQKIEETNINNFLNLEHMGWKGSNGTSLLSNPANESFFREMISGFASCGRAFFTELKVNDRTIASTVNMISSKMGYAFKIGWDTEFAAASPGMLNEIEFIKNAATLYPHLKYIDSGAEEGSFIEKIWVDRYTLLSGFYITKTIAWPVVDFFDVARWAKYRFINLFKRQ